MLRYISLSMITVSAVFFFSCSEGILAPGDVAIHMTGLYRLESRTFVAQDSASTVLSVQIPPEVRSSLVLNADGRYGQVDSIETEQGLQVFTETGRWSVLADEFYLESDAERFAIEKFTYDRERLVRTLADQQGNVPSGFFSIVDVWRQ